MIILKLQNIRDVPLCRALVRDVHFVIKTARYEI